jgi:outer membrane protein
MKLRSTILALLLCVGGSSVLPAEALKLTLADAIALALKNDVTLQVKALAVTAAQEGVRAAQAAYFPSVSAGANWTHQFTRTVNEVVIGGNTVERYTAPSNPLAVSASVSQPVFSFGQLRNAVRVAEASARSAELSLEEQRLSLKIQIENAFYQYLLAKESARINRETLDNYQASLDVARKLNQAGLNTSFDVLQAQVTLESFRPTVIDAENQVTIALATVADLLGLKATEAAQVELVGSLEPQKLELDLSELTQQGLQNSYQVRSLRANVQLARAQDALNRSALGPSLSGFLSYSANSGATITGQDLYSPKDWQSNFNGGLRLQLPVSSWFPWSSTVATIRQGAANLKGSELTLSSTEDSLQTTIQQALLQLEVDRQKIGSSRTNVELTRQLYDAATKQYAQGLISNLNLKDSQTSLNNAQLAYLQAIYNYQSTLINLQDTVGIELLSVE